MKATAWLLLYSATTLFTLTAAAATLGDAPVVVEMGLHHRVWQTTKVDESGQTNVSAYTELATGLNFLNPETGLFEISDSSFEITKEGFAVSRRGQHQVILSPNLNTAEGVIDFKTPDGHRMRSGILGLNLFDPVSGKSLQIASVTNSIGQQTAPNEITYFDAFDTLRASVRIKNERGQFHQDVLLEEKLSPEHLAALGFDAKTVRLEVWTSFHEAPAPTVREVVLKSETNAVLRAKMVEPDEVEQILNFGGVMQMPTGKAFVDGVGVGQAVRVFKQWMPTPDGKKYLVEAASYSELKPLLDTLPTAKVVAPHGPLLAGHVPPRRVTLSKKGEFQIAKADTSRRASASPQVVWDYVTINTGQSGYTFAGDSTYYISALVNLSGTTTLEAAVIKFTNNPSAKLSVNGSLVCKTSPYRIAVLTAKDDNTVGETITGSTGTPGTTKYGNGLSISTSGSALNYLRFCYANSAVTLDFSAGQISMTNMQFVSCAYPINMTSGENTIIVENSLFYSSTYVTTGGYDNFLRGSHLTVNGCQKLFTIGNGNHNGEVYLTNSILANVSALGDADVYEGSHNGFFNSPAFGSSIIPPPPSGANPFQTVGAAGHYLADNTYRNQGIMELPASLLADLKLRTTYPPTEITANIATDTVLSPQATRDTDQPDLGYHYDPLDYVVNAKTVSANLTLTGGVALGTYGASSSYGLGLSSGNFVSEGTPTRLNWIVRYNTVQEQSTPSWSASTVGASVKRLSSSAAVNTRFTGWSLPGGTGDHFNDTTDDSTPTVFTHSQFGGGKFTIDPGSVALTNCLWERVYVKLKDNADNGREWNLFNNLFYGGTLYYWARGDDPLMRAYDNLFDKTTTTKAGNKYFTHGNNGYVSIAHLSGTSAGGDKDITAPADYLDGPLGRYYYPTTGGKLSQLIDAGSRTPAQAGLYHYTVKTAADSKEGTDSVQTVDIGFHYVGVDADNQPIDSDGDGLADYFEDRNGNGTYEAGDFANWNDEDTDNDDMSDGWEWNLFGTFDRDGTGDFDGDGVSDANEHDAGTDPLSRGKVILIVDNTIGADTEVSTKIDRLVTDLVGDSWRVLRHSVERAADTPVVGDQDAWAAENAVRVREVKALIKADYDAAPGEVKSVFLIGHVPVPYSGDSLEIVGGHLEMWGAHPADTFYGEMTSAYGAGGWSDTTGFSPHTSSHPAWPMLAVLTNLVGDGKFDQNTLPSAMELGVGRVDLSRMTAFDDELGLDEASLTSLYLDKDHDFRNGAIPVQRRAIARSWNSPFYLSITGLESIFGAANVDYVADLHNKSSTLRWFPSVSGAGEDFLVGYSGGYGSAETSYGLGTTGPHSPYTGNCPVDCLNSNATQGKFLSNFVEIDSRVVFVNLYGSYFGSWDQVNDLLRAPLANPYNPGDSRYGYGLTAFWNHPAYNLALNQTTLTKMAMGACIGEAIFKGYAGNAHYALMGDPTLRMHPVQPPTSLSAVKTAGTVSLTWTASADGSVSGYNIYRAPTKQGPFVLVTAPGTVTGTTYPAVQPSAFDDPDNFYMIRAIKTETTPAGSYANMSEGVLVSRPGTATHHLEIINGPANQSVDVIDAAPVAESVAFTVDAVGTETDGDQELTYQWFKNGSSLSNSGSISGVATRALLISGVLLSDAGSYHVVVSHVGGSLASAAATLTTY